MKITMVNLPIIFEKAPYSIYKKAWPLVWPHCQFVFEVLNEILRPHPFYFSFLLGLGLYFFSFGFEPSFMTYDEVQIQQNHHFM
jgi:hypothetical protein